MVMSWVTALHMSYMVNPAIETAAVVSGEDKGFSRLADVVSYKHAILPKRSPYMHAKRQLIANPYLQRRRAHNTLARTHTCECLHLHPCASLSLGAGNYVNTLTLLV